MGDNPFAGEPRPQHVLRPLVFAACGGDVVHRGTHVLSEDDIRHLASVFEDERRAAWAAADGRSYIEATRLSDELLTAFYRAREWRRASGPYVSNHSTGRG